jgi:hypothetical protein
MAKFPRNGNWECKRAIACAAAAHLVAVAVALRAFRRTYPAALSPSLARAPCPHSHFRARATRACLQWHRRYGRWRRIAWAQYGTAPHRIASPGMA